MRDIGKSAPTLRRWLLGLLFLVAIGLVGGRPAMAQEPPMDDPSMGGADPMGGEPAPAPAPSKKKKGKKDPFGADPIALEAEQKAADKKNKKKKITIRPGAQFAYESFSVTGGGANFPMSGFATDILGQMNYVVMPKIGLAALGYAGFGFAFESGKDNVDGINIDFDFNPVYLSFGGGVSYPIPKKPKISVDFTLGYDLGLMGSGNAKSGTGRTGFDIEQYRRFHIAPAVRYAVEKNLQIGGGFSYWTGQIQLKDLNENAVRDPLDQKGFSLRFGAFWEL